MDGLLRRRGEDLDLGPTTNRVMSALDRAIRAAYPMVVTQPAGPGPWTAYYQDDVLIALARPTVAGPPGAVDVSVPAASWGRTLTGPADVEDPELASALRGGVGGRPDRGINAYPFAASDLGGLGAVIALVAVLVAAVALIVRLVRRRKADRVLESTGGRDVLRVLRAARFEASMRGSSLSIGCVASTLLFFGLSYAIGLAVTWLAPGGGLGWLGTVLILVVFVVAIALFRWIRRRYPSPPQRRRDRVIGISVLAVIVMVIGTFVVLLLLAPR